MFERLIRDGKLLGLTLRRQRWLFFFGSALVSKDELPLLFPNFAFCFLRQVHGTNIVPAAKPYSGEADGHYTDQVHQALVVQSADCIPLLLAGQDQVCALHAGWRGVAANIVNRAHATLPHFQPEVAAIGPHIGRKSFVVGRDVAQLLQHAAPAGTSSQLTQADPLDAEKVLFDLNSLLRLQLKAAFNPSLDLLDCHEDSKTNLNFHSFRRDGERAGRNLSFVVINP